MTENLFPVFEVPSDLAEEDEQIAIQYPLAPLWNFEKGDFVENWTQQPNGTRQPIYGSGYDAWVQWCRKTALTQRWAHAAYGENAGIEAEEALREPDRTAIESAFEETITEALLADPLGRTQQVSDFQFDWNGDELHIACEVLGSDGNAATIDTALKM